jgi:predicted HTH domain antitoxin
MDHPSLAERLGVLIDQGIFKDEESLKNSAYRSLLTLRPELKVEIALPLYKREEISLGRAAVIAGLSREELKEVMASRDIERRIPSLSSEDVEVGVHRLLDRRSQSL